LLLADSKLVTILKQYMAKKRIVKDYDKLPKEIVQSVKMEYPNGFAHKLIMYTGPKGEKVSALPFETEEVYYLIRMTILEARQIIKDDEDYDDDGRLREDYSLDELDLDSIDDEDEKPAKKTVSHSSSSDDDDDDDYAPRRGGRRRDDDDDDEDY
jgi:DNA-directed RNA polymerase subunit delta